MQHHHHHHPAIDLHQQAKPVNLLSFHTTKTQPIIPPAIMIMMMMKKSFLRLLTLTIISIASSYSAFGFQVPSSACSLRPLSSLATTITITTARSSRSSFHQRLPLLLLRNSADPSNNEGATTNTVNDDDDDDDDPMAAAMMDAETRLAMEKARKANELRSQEVFMTKSTGKHKCSNCDWEYDETKGDAMLIGGMIKPGTTFDQLPSNWRCPVCRASKDSFQEVVEEIPGFAVNQGYGLGTNAWTSEQKSTAIFGGLFLFFLLFLSGYAMS